jgi:hypothetical protein
VYAVIATCLVQGKGIAAGREEYEGLHGRYIGGSGACWEQSCGFSRSRLGKISFLGLFAATMIVAPFEAFAAPPSGAIKLPKSRLS